MIVDYLIFVVRNCSDDTTSATRILFEIKNFYTVILMTYFRWRNL